MAIEIHGFCERRFEPLKEALRKNFEDDLELGASLAVTHHGKPVVDLWAGFADVNRTRPWQRDTLVLITSTGKIAIIFSLLILVDRGLVDLDSPVARYWPEFAAGGKEHATVRDVLTHRAGVPGFDPPIVFDEATEWETLTRNIASQKHWFHGERVICYHGVTFPVILGEIIRGVDGRPMHQFFREEMAKRAGIDVVLTPCSADERMRIAEIRTAAPTSATRFDDELANRVWASAVMGDPGAISNAGPGRPGAYGNGRAIAKLCAIGATGGELNGVRYVSKSLIDAASSLQAEGVDPMLGPIRFGLGFGLDHWEFPAPSATSFHWGGYGGSYGIMDQAKEISCGYAPNNWIMPNDARGTRMWKTLGEIMAAL